ncbi:hypothetical protein [Frondihabitans sp. PAMC 28766]|uniref:hypothetical protein n=1 Tax=Frondihabitans sp. PAMC 28766 TaxID=1795630 RepID=UPI0012FF8EC3|nr:hypothetical protein [Frondihabitans sp. PAMC 28766]
MTFEQDDDDRAIATILREANKGHSAALMADTDPTGLCMPNVAVYLLRKSSKSVRLTSESSVDNLSAAFFLFLSYDVWDRALRIAREVADIPKLRWGQFEPLRDMLQGARWYAARHGLHEIVDELAASAFQPSDYEPLFMDGGILKRPLDKPSSRANVGLDPSRPNDAYPTNDRPLHFLDDLAMMSTMWGYGGSKEWPVERLEAERERLEAAMKELPGMAPLG